MMLQTTFQHSRGIELPARGTVNDTGGQHTKMAYELCRTFLARCVWATKAGKPADAI